ncbi:MAG: DnaJ domain-containing protein [Candidatus Pacebacteria bacterium]|nr:DnaJ domain-containing protein [Candidatus Paceibacterota bacterium]
MSTKRDYYEILGVKKGSSQAEIKSAYRKMALKFHPDKNKEKDAEAKFKEINEAYQILSDEKKRQAYDQFGHAAFDPTSGGFGAGNPFSGFQGGGPFTWTYQTSSSGGAQDFDFNDPFEIFESIFGGGFGRAAHRPRYGLTIEFMEAVHGVTKEVEVEGKKQQVKIPAGANDGTRIRFENFDVTIEVKTHERFKRDGYDVFLTEKIPLSVAILGGSIEIPTLREDHLKMKIRPGTQSGSLIRLRGEGVPHLRSRGNGDLYIKILVEIPEKLSREQKQLVKELQDAGL